MQKENIDYTFKILLLGNTGVGKTSLLLQYTENKFLNSLLGTIGIDFRKKTIKFYQKTIQLYFWDTAGQEKFRSLTKNYYKDADGVLLVYDVTSQKSFDDLQFWLQESTNINEKKNIPFVIIGNKTDLKNREVDTYIGEDYAKKNGFKYIETSVKLNKNVEKCFEMIVSSIFEKLGKKLIECKNTININNNIDIIKDENTNQCGCLGN